MQGSIAAAASAAVLTKLFRPIECEICGLRGFAGSQGVRIKQHQLFRQCRATAKDRFVLDGLGNDLQRLLVTNVKEEIIARFFFFRNLLSERIASLFHYTDIEEVNLSARLALKDVHQIGFRHRMDRIAAEFRILQLPAVHIMDRTDSGSAVFFGKTENNDRELLIQRIQHSVEFRTDIASEHRASFVDKGPAA